ncbi:uncharacterized protein LOC110432670 [Sorghum bicolor]|uniref:uncharacterized protein LOC110432670 n=1 Tax=Sorghum bicolor TaxID=4558 RepID=UPI000B424C6E|nr:uncharacterized protein LOC110432670 [Sorghum bicolor]|eukprot:XP_021309125.1 uncharacterized protein LOC110432670 [Sorghum bicolor]
MTLDPTDLPRTLLTAGGALSRGLAAGPRAAVGAGIAPFPAPPPLPVMHRPDSTLIAALATARAAAAEGRARVREAALAWERERDAADALARQIADAEQFLGLPASPDVGTTSSGSAPVVWHDPADPHVVQLHYQAGGVQNIRLLVPVVLKPESPSYARWRDLVLLTLRRYALDDHVLLDTAGAVPTPSWLRLDSVILSGFWGRSPWTSTTSPGSAARRELLHLRPGDLSISEYCRQMKGMADSLDDLGWPVEDRILVLNVLRGLSDRYSYLRTWITRQRPFPTFLQVSDDLIMEELTQGLQPGSTPTPGSSSSSTALAATLPPCPAAPPQSSLLGPLPPGPSGGGGAVAAAVAVVGDVEQASGGEPRPPAAMLAGATPGFPSVTPLAAPFPASSWATPPAPLPRCAGWDQAALAHSFNTMALTPPVVPEWVADSGATYHTTPNPGILSSVHPPSPSLPSSIMVANGSCLPVTSVGAAGPHGSFRLPDVLVAPSMSYYEGFGFPASSAPL